MLRQLRIENYAIIDTLEIDFSAGLNTITGETGAGKSILLGALGLLAGARSETSAIDQNERNCVIEAEFEVDPTDSIWSQNDIDVPGNEVIIRRVITPQGRSRAFVNDEPVSLTVLKELSTTLVDIHSQHQTLLLAKSDYQISTLDSLAEISLSKYSQLYGELKESQRQLRQTREAAAESKARAEYLEYQVGQIEQAKVDPTKVEQMEQRVAMLSNATQLAEELGYAATAMQNEEGGVVSALKNARQALERIEKTMPQAADYAERMKSLYIEAKDLAHELETAAGNVEINPAELQMLEEQMDTIYGLMHKHSVETPSELVELYGQMQKELGELVDVDNRVERLEKEVDQLQNDSQQEARKISEARRKSVPAIEREIKKTLQELGIKDAQFTIEITASDELTPTGSDNVEMLFSGNAGKKPQPIQHVASGGEMSRLMLAIKGMLARTARLPIIVFDEIDTGVSGTVADKMGQIIERMGQSMQVLNITHLPQVAAKGDNHYFVYKDSGGTHIRKLDAQERIDHIAMMLSGSTVTEAAKIQAQELLKK